MNGKLLPPFSVYVHKKEYYCYQTMYRSGKRRRKPLVSHVIRQKNLERFLGGGCESTTQENATEGNIEEENELCTHLPEDCNNDLEDIDGVVTGNDPGTGNVGVNVVEGTTLSHHFGYIDSGLIQSPTRTE